MNLYKKIALGLVAGVALKEIKKIVQQRIFQLKLQRKL